MIANPFASPLFVQIAIALGTLLAAFLMAIAVTHRLRFGELRRSVLFQRWRVWAIIAPVFSLAALAGAIPLATLVAGIAAIGAWEYGRLARVPRTHVGLLVMGAAVTPFVALGSPSAALAAGSVAVLAATGLPLVLRSDGHAVQSAAFMLLGIGWLAWLPAHVVLLGLSGQDGTVLVLALGLAVALSDVGAFVVGKAFGRHKLAPSISPNKTVEGLIGNIVGAYGGFLLVAAVSGVDLPLHVLLTAPVVIALGCVWGDLAESALKREFKQKDAGGWLPGFGGLLDRADSLLVAAPLLFYFLRLLA